MNTPVEIQIIPLDEIIEDGVFSDFRHQNIFIHKGVQLYGILSYVWVDDNGDDIVEGVILSEGEDGKLTKLQTKDIQAILTKEFESEEFKSASDEVIELVLKEKLYITEETKTISFTITKETKYIITKN